MPFERMLAAAVGAMLVLAPGAARAECPEVDDISTSTSQWEELPAAQVRCLRDLVRDGERMGWLDAGAAADAREDLDQLRPGGNGWPNGLDRYRLQEVAARLRMARLKGEVRSDRRPAEIRGAPSPTSRRASATAPR